MSFNAALVTDAAKLAARENLDAYAQVVYDHITGDYENHSELLVYNQVFSDNAGHTDSTLSLRVGATLGVTDYAVLTPIISTGTATSGGALPIITIQPVDTTTTVGNTSTLYVVALSSSSSDLTYQWYKDSILYTGQTDAQLVLINSEVSDSGQYYVVVSNDFGSVISSTIELTVSAATSGRTGGAGSGPSTELP